MKDVPSPSHPGQTSDPPYPEYPSVVELRNQLLLLAARLERVEKALDILTRTWDGMTISPRDIRAALGLLNDADPSP
jgi:hypothetical protein